MEWIADPSAWMGLATLVVLELVLGIDNLVFIAIIADKLPPAQRDRARLVGLSLALVMRLVLLASISWLITLTSPLFGILGHTFSGRDLILLGGGLFLLFKATMELHERLEGTEQHTTGRQVYAGFGVVIAQIVVLDAVFSLDSVITAVGMAQHIEVMIAAVLIAAVVMLVFAGPISDFVAKHPTMKMLALSFLILIGVLLVAEAFDQHIDRGYIYFAMAFALVVEVLNMRVRAKARPVELRHSQLPRERA